MAENAPSLAEITRKASAGEVTASVDRAVKAGQVKVEREGERPAGRGHLLTVQAQFEEALTKAGGDLERIKSSPVYVEYQRAWAENAAAARAGRDYASSLVQTISRDSGENAQANLEALLMGNMERVLGLVRNIHPEVVWDTEAATAMEMVLRTTLANAWVEGTRSVHPEVLATPEWASLQAITNLQSELLPVPPEPEGEVVSSLPPTPGPEESTARPLGTSDETLRGVAITAAALAAEAAIDQFQQRGDAGMTAAAHALREAAQELRGAASDVRQPPRPERREAVASREIVSRTEDLTTISYEALRQRLETETDSDVLKILMIEKQRRIEAVQSQHLYDFNRRDLEGLIINTLRVTNSENFVPDLFRLADNAENQANGKNSYKRNPLYRGLVLDVLRQEVQAVVLEVLQGMPEADRQARNISQATLGAMEGALRSRIPLTSVITPGVYLAAEPTEAQLDEYARLVPGGEAVVARRRRADEIRRQEEQRRIALERLRQEAQAQRVGPGALPYERMMGFGPLPRIEVEGRNETLFSLDFLEVHGLPHTIYVPELTGQGYAARGYDMLDLLTHIVESGDIPAELQYKYIKDALQEEGADAERLRESHAAWLKFRDGILPLMIGRIVISDGYLSSFGGDASKGVGGILEPRPPKGRNSTGVTVNLRDIVAAWRNDEQAKRALAIFEAADGMPVGRMPHSDVLFASSYRTELRNMLEISFKKDGNIHADVVNRMREIAEEIAVHLGCDRGRVELMLVLYTMLGGPQMINEYRELWFDYSDLRRDPKDVMMWRIINKLKPGDGDIGFGFAGREMQAGGIDGLFDAFLKLKDPYILWKYYAGTLFVLDTMKKVKQMWEGLDEFPDTDSREKEKDKLVQALGKGDPPMVSKTTVKLIREHPIHNGKGKLFAAGRPSFWDTRRGLQRMWDQISR